MLQCQQAFFLEWTYQYPSAPADIIRLESFWFQATQNMAVLFVYKTKKI